MIINDKFPLRNDGFSNTITNFNSPRHRWYYFKEGFSPSLVEYALACSDLKDSDYVFDPFNGSGTVTLTCAENNISSIGVEVNPFASFLANTKVVDLSKRDIEKFENGFYKSIKRASYYSPLVGFSTFSKHKLNSEKWLFNNSVLNSFQSGIVHLKSVSSKKMRDVFKLCLIGAALDNSNAIRDGKCLRYKNNWQDLRYSKESFLSSFKDRISIVKSDLAEVELDSSYVKIFNSDIRKFLDDSNLSKFKLCITSPPYLNSFDYTDIYRPELFLGGFIDSQEEFRKLRKNTLRSHANVSAKMDSSLDFGYVYNESLLKIGKSMATKWQNKLPIMIQSYFEDMELVLRKLRKIAKNDSQLWMVVSNSAYNNVELPVDLILAEIGTRNKWKLREIGVLRNINKRRTKFSPNITSLRESVIIFDF